MNSDTNQSTDKGNRLYLAFLAIIAALGGFLFGYDTAIISGTLSFVSEQFQLGDEGWYVSSALVGCLAGAAVAGLLADRYGRKPVLILSGFMFSLSAIGCAVAYGMTDLIVYRITGGVGVGLASMVSPMYISEVSPARVRGSLVSLYQFALCLGILIAYLANAGILTQAMEAETVPTGFWGHIFYDELWRGMLGSEAIPAVLFMLLVMAVPESPRWLVKSGRHDKARRILSRIGGQAAAQKQMGEIEASLAEKKANIRVLLQKPWLKVLLLGMAVMFLSQLSGINAVIYYGPKIMESAGLTISDALGGQVVIGIVNALFVTIAIFTVDRLGRKKLLLGGITGIMVMHLILGTLFYLDLAQGWVLLTPILLFIMFFELSYGPVGYVVVSEIFPNRMRGLAMTFAIVSLWAGTALIGWIVPKMLLHLGPHGTFWTFALCCVPALVIIARVLPETKGRSLEEIEHFWQERFGK